MTGNTRLTVVLGLAGLLWTITRPMPEPANETLAAVPLASPPLRPTCSQFHSQAQAQAFYRANPRVALVLDGDRDGVACEDLSGPYDRTPVRGMP